MSDDLIIIIDDEPDILVTLELSCKNKGLSALTFSDGESGLKALRENHTAVIITDNMMPGLSGIEVLKKAQEISPDTTRVLLSGGLNLDMALDAVREGSVYRILAKPCSDSEFESTVYECLEKYHMLQDYHRLQKERLEQTKVEAVKATVVTLHHEINNALVSLGANVSILKRSFDKNSIPRNHDQILASLKDSYTRIKNCIIELELTEDINMSEYATGSMMLDSKFIDKKQPSADKKQP